MIDFDTLVLGPCVSIFGRPIIVTPIASQPGDPVAVPPVPAGLPYFATGVWASRPTDVVTETGILSSQVHTLGIRVLDFPIPPVAGDTVEVDAAGSLPRIGFCLIEDTDDDGQGGTVLTLKVLDGPP